MAASTSITTSSPPSTGSPCAACKFLRRKCTLECAFAPYFPPDQPQRFVNVHKIFGASNVTKLINEVPLHQREDAVNSLVYEAEARMKDPVYGCVGAISLLQQKIAHLQAELAIARSELARYAAYTGALMAPGFHGGVNASPTSPLLQAVPVGPPSLSAIVVGSQSQELQAQQHPQHVHMQQQHQQAVTLMSPPSTDHHESMIQQNLYMPTDVGSSSASSGLSSTPPSSSKTRMVTKFKAEPA